MARSISDQAGDSPMLLSDEQRFNQLCAEINGALTASGITVEAILATLPETRKRLYARRYS
jgi:hypothetical protein